MNTQLHTLKTQSITDIEAVQTLEEIQELQHALLGKKGRLTDILRGIKDLSHEQKITLGKESNDLKKEIRSVLEKREKEIQAQTVEKQLREEFEDMSIPSTNPTTHHQHPIKSDIRELIDVFMRMGFDVHGSKDITTEYENFDALNMPKWHPARDMQDTFWLEDGFVLATQTSCLQNYLLKTKPIPFRAIVIGPTYRNEKIDATHDVMFDQVEGMVVGEKISIGHLRHTIEEMLDGIFGFKPKTRMRPGYFPFVEPGMEMDIWWEIQKDGRTQGKWLEFMGCGLIHPNVLIAGEVDPKKFTGFAFGFGLTRLTMIRYGIDDIRHIHQNKIAFLEQFSGN